MESFWRETFSLVAAAAKVDDIIPVYERLLFFAQKLLGCYHPFQWDNSRRWKNEVHSVFPFQEAKDRCLEYFEGQSIHEEKEEDVCMAYAEEWSIGSRKNTNAAWYYRESFQSLPPAGSSLKDHPWHLAANVFPEVEGKLFSADMYSTWEFQPGGLWHSLLAFEESSNLYVDGSPYPMSQLWERTQEYSVRWKVPEEVEALFEQESPEKLLQAFAVASQGMEDTLCSWLDLDDSTDSLQLQALKIESFSIFQLLGSSHFLSLTSASQLMIQQFPHCG